MSKRYAVLGLSVFLALALAVPAFGGPTNPVASVSASVKSIANKALKKAKAAQNTANAASSAATAASSAASQAESDAKKAQTTANTAQSTANSAKSIAESAKSTADSAKSTADSAKTAAANAEANANTRLKGASQVVGTATAENTESPKLASASCPSGNEVLGGGYSIGGEGNKVTVTQSEVQLYGGGWFIDATAIAGQTPTWSLTAIAMCGFK